MFKPSTILLPIDLKVNGFEALSFAIDFAKQFGAELHCFYVNSPQAGYRSPKVSVEQLQERVEEAAGSALADLRVHFAVSQGDLGNETREYNQEHAVDLVITTHEHHMRFYSSFLDTADEEIIDTVKVPVLVMPKDYLQTRES